MGNLDFFFYIKIRAMFDFSFTEMVWRTMGANWHWFFDVSQLAISKYFSRLLGRRDLSCFFVHEARDCRKFFIYILFLLLFLLNVPGAALLKDYLL